MRGGRASVREILFIVASITSLAIFRVHRINRLNTVAKVSVSATINVTLATAAIPY